MEGLEIYGLLLDAPAHRGRNYMFVYYFIDFLLPTNEAFMRNEMYNVLIKQFKLIVKMVDFKPS